MAPHEESHTLSLWFGSEQVNKTQMSPMLNTTQLQYSDTLCCVALNWHVHSQSAAVLRVFLRLRCANSVSQQVLSSMKGTSFGQPM